MLTLSAVVPEPSAGCREALAGMAEDVVPELDSISAEMAQAIHAAMDVLTEDMLEDTHASAKANISLVVAMLRDGVDPAGVQPPAEALHYAREFVHRGLPVEALLGVYRVGHGAFWQIWLERMRDAIENREILAEAIAYCSAWTFGYVDAVSGPLATAFVHEKERWARSAVAQRAEEIRTILEGRPVDEQRTSQRLRYELGRRHVAFVLWGEETADAEDAGSAFAQVAATVANTLGCASPLIVPSGRSVVWGWITLASADADPIATTAELVPHLAKARARIAFGEPGLGVDGFRRSHAEALTARRVALLGQRAVGARVRFDDIALTALLTTDLAEARRYVERELGPLCEETDAMRRLVATLRVFLEEGASFVRAARRLSVHENTVAYRVKRAADLLGHRVEEGALRLHVALLLCEVLRRAEE
ncbi:MAG: regulatory protein [Solirubrobacterales bacterium]|nr:regulatory protein [Solirubrobacterales bacterium]